MKPLTVTIPTARQITGLGNTTIWKLIGEKKLSTIRVGRRVLVTVASLEKLLSPAVQEREADGWIGDDEAPYDL